MTTSVSKPALNLRERLTQLQHLLSNTKPDLVRLPPFKSYISNGTFDTAVTGWSVPVDGRGTVTAVGGKMRVMAVTGRSYAYAHQKMTGLLINASYIVKWSPSAVTTQYATRIALSTSEGGSNIAVSVAASVSGEQQLLVPMTAKSAFLHTSVFTGTEAVGMDFDNVSVWEADPVDGEPWLRLPYGFKVNDRAGKVFRDGLLLGLDAYEEKNVLGQTWIKPMTAPGPNTTFDIWAGV